MIIFNLPSSFFFSGPIKTHLSKSGEALDHKQKKTVFLCVARLSEIRPRKYCLTDVFFNFLHPETL